MPLSLDFAMPIALLLVVTIALLLNKRVEGKLASTIEQKEFKTRDVVLLIVGMASVISIIAVITFLNPGAVFRNILLVIFMSSYTMLLFTFSYVLSNVTKIRAQIVSVGFGIAALTAGFTCLISSFQDNYTVFRVGVFVGLAVFCFGVALYEQYKTIAKSRWYVAAQPPAIFVLLFVFFNFLSNSGTAAVWFPFIMDIFGLTFALLIILYLSSVFSWKTVGLFAILLTIMDMILVFSGPMVTAAKSFTGLGLPVLVFLPNVPLIPAAEGATSFLGFAARGLGLGDFFFAGVLAIQTYKKFGQKTAFIAIGCMTVAFGIWEAFLLDIMHVLSPILGHELLGFPGTLMIISGWAPVIVWAVLSNRGKKPIEPQIIQPNSPSATPNSENPPTTS
jgi:hypothetical protein